MSILNSINSPEDVKKLDKVEVQILCNDLRDFIVDKVSKNGGHLASNLGVVELTVAIHRVFDTAKDRLVFDVGHQCYAHKILTGRRDSFSTLRKLNGISGYPKPLESEHDAFIAGHASNSISVGLGMARQRTRSGEDYDVISFIGDGALTGGMAYEALCDAGGSGEPLIVILNDNGMAITPNVGGMARYLERLRMKPGYLSFKEWYRKAMDTLPGGKRFYRFTHSVKRAVKDSVLNCSMFEKVGFQYIGPVDGHDVEKVTEVLRWARELKQPVIIHAITQKGRGYTFSEQNPDEYHGVSQFNCENGVVPPGGDNFSAVFGHKLTELAGKDKRVCAITAAMTSGTGLTKFASALPRRFFDIGIAEGHGVAMAAGMAKQGAIPVFAVYSTFLQRGYDMLLHDIGIGGLHVVLAVDRAGLVGDDGETHHGVFDISYLSSVPGMKIYSPASFAELGDMLEEAVLGTAGPVAVRYPRGGQGRYTDGGTEAVKRICSGSDITILAYGTQINTALNVSDILAQHGISAEILKLGVVSPLDIDPIANSVRKTGRLLVIEECVSSGCVGSQVVSALAQRSECPQKVILKNIGERFVTHGRPEELLKLCGLDAESVAESVLKELKYE